MTAVVGIHVLYLLAIMLLAPTEQSKTWRRLSDTDQGARFVDLASARRKGRYASVETELRMEPTIKRVEHFDCVRLKVLSDVSMHRDVHDLTLVPAGQEWTPVNSSSDHFIMLKLACGVDRSRGSR
jgi:hypothetical protein